jgi:protein-disulfide isomerase
MKRTILLLSLLGLPAAASCQAPGAPEPSSLERAEQARSKGAHDAPVTIVELSDFQCPYCADFARNTLPALDSVYVRTGKVRMIFLNFPLPNHGSSWVAAEAAMCAGAQGAFWPMHDRLFATQQEWGGGSDAHEHFARYAADLSLDSDAFEWCVERDLMATLLSVDLMQSVRSGAGATPTFVINGRHVLSGAQPFTAFAEIIDPILAGAGTDQEGS